MEPELVILNIDTWSSRCMSCGGGADPNENAHDSLLGYSVARDAKGCGKTFTHVTSDYAGPAGARGVTVMRPDLTWIDSDKAHEYTSKQGRKGYAS